VVARDVPRTLCTYENSDQLSQPSEMKRLCARYMFLATSAMRSLLRMVEEILDWTGKVGLAKRGSEAEAPSVTYVPLEFLSPLM